MIKSLVIVFRIAIPMACWQQIGLDLAEGPTLFDLPLQILAIILVASYLISFPIEHGLNRFAHKIRGQMALKSFLMSILFVLVLSVTFLSIGLYSGKDFKEKREEAIADLKKDISDKDSEIAKLKQEFNSMNWMRGEGITERNGGIIIK